MGNDMKYLPLEMLRRMDEKLSLLNSYRPLPSAAVRKLREQFGIEMTTICALYRAGGTAVA
jgi:hypothetical protein